MVLTVLLSCLGFPSLPYIVPFLGGFTPTEKKKNPIFSLIVYNAISQIIGVSQLFKIILQLYAYLFVLIHTNVNSVIGNKISALKAP